MEAGLAQQMVYGSGENQTIKHHYAGVINKKSKKKVKKTCKKRTS